jgi:peptide/nickel transport system substrate-binding protein
MLAFRNGSLDMLYRLQYEMAKELLGDYEKAKTRKDGGFVLQTVDMLNLSYYGFLTNKPPFNNVKVRQAFAHAIDRNTLALKLLKGEVEPAIHGYVPRSMLNYNGERVKELGFDPLLARKLLAEAGYPNGKNFPEIKLTLPEGTAGRNLMLAEYLINQVKEILGISIGLNPLPVGTLIDAAQSGKLQLWQMTWFADYPDPEAFLTLFYGGNVPADSTEKSSLNMSRYINLQFDSLFNAANAEINTVQRMALLRSADQLAINDAPLLPICYGRADRVLKPYVRGFDMNAMEYRDMSLVWLDKPANQVVEKK